MLEHALQQVVPLAHLRVRELLQEVRAAAVREAQQPFDRQCRSRGRDHADAPLPQPPAQQRQQAPDRQESHRRVLGLQRQPPQRAGDDGRAERPAVERALQPDHPRQPEREHRHLEHQVEPGQHRRAERDRHGHRDRTAPQPAMQQRQQAPAEQPLHRQEPQVPADHRVAEQPDAGRPVVRVHRRDHDRPAGHRLLVPDRLELVRVQRVRGDLRGVVVVADVVDRDRLQQVGRVHREREQQRDPGGAVPRLQRWGQHRNGRRGPHHSERRGHVAALWPVSDHRRSGALDWTARLRRPRRCVLGLANVWPPP